MTGRAVDIRRLAILRPVAIAVFALFLSGCPRMAYLELHNFSERPVELSISGGQAHAVGVGDHVRLRAGGRSLQIASSDRNATYVLLIPHGGQDGPYFDGTLRVRLDEDGALVALRRREDPSEAQGKHQPEGFPLWPAEPTRAQNVLALTSAEKVHYTEVLDSAREHGHITRDQYDSSQYWMDASPCDEVDTSLSLENKLQLESAIGLSTGIQGVEVLRLFRYSGWFVTFSTASPGDPPYSFFHADPRYGASPVLQWSGAATIFETTELIEWFRQQNPTIPQPLGNCVAWYITLGSR